VGRPLFRQPMVVVGTRRRGPRGAVYLADNRTRRKRRATAATLAAGRTCARVATRRGRRMAPTRRLRTRAGGQELPNHVFADFGESRGRISGAYSSTITGDQRPIAGQVDKDSQCVAWRIGENTETIFETSPANLTQDVSPVAIHFGKGQTQIWLLVRMPEPAAAGQQQKLPEAPI
jgi:hypothetical protein